MESVKKICEDVGSEFCPVETGIELLTGKWKGRILWKLYQRPVLRFGELRRLLPEITEKILTQQLRELESARLVTRRIYAQVPPRVEYSLSEFGASVCPILDKFAEWGLANKEKIMEITAVQPSFKRVTLVS